MLIVKKQLKRKLKQNLALLTLMVSAFLSGCVATSIDAPCPHFGATCHKTPVNVWDYPK